MLHVFVYLIGKGAVEQNFVAATEGWGKVTWFAGGDNLCSRLPRIDSSDLAHTERCM